MFSKDRRLYYGLFQNYEKDENGEVVSITLINVQRYCYDEIAECLARGDNPVHDFGGPLLIRWEMVADINTVPEDRVGKIRTRYDRALQSWSQLSDRQKKRLGGVVPYRTEDL